MRIDQPTAAFWEWRTSSRHPICCVFELSGNQWLREALQFWASSFWRSPVLDRKGDYSCPDLPRAASVSAQFSAEWTENDILAPEASERGEETCSKGQSKEIEVESPQCRFLHSWPWSIGFIWINRICEYSCNIVWIARIHCGTCKMTDPAGHQDSHLCSPREKAFHLDRHAWRFWEGLRYSI